VLNVDNTASQRSEKIDLGAVEEIVVLPLETLVWLLLNLKLHITRFDTWNLITLAREIDLGSVLDTFVNVYVQNFALNSRLLALASLATIAVLDHFSLTVAVRAHRLESLNHGAHLSHHHLHTLAVAASALLNRTLLATTTITAWADD